jgi:DNA modification methylase
MTPEHLDSGVTLYSADCLAVLPTLADCSVDSCVTDPPYHLQSIHKRFAAKGRDETSERYTAGPYGRTAAGFMGKKWDGGDIAFRPAVWREVFRMLKPGAHLLAFGGTRTYHRMACAIEDAGFEIRDCIQWLYGSGFPKSRDVSKAIDKAVGAKGTFGDPKSVAHAGWIDRGAMRGADGHEGYQRPWMQDEEAIDRAARQYIPGSHEGTHWSGFGTALKPACEPIVLARKPLSEPNVAANVLEWGTGALNIDGCRVEGPMDGVWGTSNKTINQDRMFNGSPEMGDYRSAPHDAGRWPANVIHDGSDEVVAGFPETASGLYKPSHADKGKQSGILGAMNGREREHETFGDAGSAARFFYTAKADSDDRLGSKHPTIKPLDLMQYLVRLVTPPNGLVLDPFAGTGTTGEACFRERMRAILIEKEAEYQADIRRRMKLALAGPDERARAAIKEKLKDKPVDAGPLFGATA